MSLRRLSLFTRAPVALAPISPFCGALNSFTSLRAAGLSERCFTQGACVAGLLADDLRGCILDDARAMLIGPIVPTKSSGV